MPTPRTSDVRCLKGKGSSCEPMAAQLVSLCLLLLPRFAWPSVPGVLQLPLNSNYGYDTLVVRVGFLAADFLVGLVLFLLPGWVTLRFECSAVPCTEPMAYCSGMLVVGTTLVVEDVGPSLHRVLLLPLAYCWCALCLENFGSLFPWPTDLVRCLRLVHCVVCFELLRTLALSAFSDLLCTAQVSSSQVGSLGNAASPPQIRRKHFGVWCLLAETSS